MTKTKKIIIFIIAAVILGALAYWFFTRPTGSDQPNGNSGSGFNIKNFFPFGNPDTGTIDNSQNVNNSDNNNNNSDTGNNQASSTIVNVPIVKLRKISDRPVAGEVVFNQSTTSIVRFVEKANGNVYEARSDSSEIVRISNETIPKLMRAFWLPDGSGFLAQTVDDNEVIYTSFIRLTASGTEKSDLPTGINEISISPDGKKIFYLINNAGAKGYVSNPDGTKANIVFSNPLSEWLPHWYSASSILLSSKASFAASSYGFVLNPNTKSVSTSYSGASGASALPSADGNSIILGSAGSPSLSIFNSSDLSVSSTNAKTLPEKCAWDKEDAKFIFCAVPKQVSGTYPDSWYKGTISTDDLIEKINPFDDYFYILTDPDKETGGESIDAFNLQSSKDGNFIIFTNKIDSSLWMLDMR